MLLIALAGSNTNAQNFFLTNGKTLGKEEVSGTKNSSENNDSLQTYDAQEVPKRNVYSTYGEIAIMTLDCGLSRKSQDSKRGLE